MNRIFPIFISCVLFAQINVMTLPARDIQDALFYERKGDIDKAKIIYQKLLEKNPKNRQAYQRLKEILKRTFSETGGYDEVIMLKDIRIESHCEHHIAPFIGNAHVAYLPNKRVVGISKLARITNIFAKRMQVQEKLTSEIATCIQDCLKPKGVAVVVEAQHECMTTRGVHMPGISMVTSKLLGKFRTDASTRREFYSCLLYTSDAADE